MTVPNADIAAKRDGHQPTAQSSQRLAPFPHQNERRPNRRIGIVNGRPVRGAIGVKFGVGDAACGEQAIVLQ